MPTQSAVQTQIPLRDQVADQAIMDLCFQSTAPVKIRKNQAVIIVSFLRQHFDRFVQHHMDNGSTGLAAESAIAELEAQI